MFTSANGVYLPVVGNSDSYHDFDSNIADEWITCDIQ